MTAIKLRQTLKLLLTIGACGAVLAGWAVRRMDAQGTSPERNGSAEPMSRVPTIKQRASSPEDVVRKIVENDPFDSFRGQLIPAGDGSRHSPAENSPPDRVLPALTLLGTVITSPNVGFAVIAVEGQIPAMLTVGDTLQGFLLRKVRRGEVTLVGPDTTIELTLTAPRTVN